MVYVYDDNHISIDGPTELALTDDPVKRFEGYGWHVQYLGEVANDLDALEEQGAAKRTHGGVLYSGGMPRLAEFELIKSRDVWSGVESTSKAEGPSAPVRSRWGKFTLAKPSGESSTRWAPANALTRWSCDLQWQ
jgi:hypothetical protein